MLSQIHDPIGTPPHTRAATAPCASVRKATVEERKLAQATDRHAMRAARILEDTMSLYALLAAPADVFYVVQSTGARGRREHRLSSVLYQTRPHARAELLRLSAACPGDYAVWKGTTHIEPPEWGHVVMLADGTLVPPGAAHATVSAAP